MILDQRTVTGGQAVVDRLLFSGARDGVVHNMCVGDGTVVRVVNQGVLVDSRSSSCCGRDCAVAVSMLQTTADDCANELTSRCRRACEVRRGHRGDGCRLCRLSRGQV